MHMNDPITRVVWIVVQMRSGWKMRMTEIFGRRRARASCRFSQTGLSGTRERIHSVKSAGTIATQNITRHARSGVPLKSG